MYIFSIRGCNLFIFKMYLDMRLPIVIHIHENFWSTWEITTRCEIRVRSHWPFSDNISVAKKWVECQFLAMTANAVAKRAVWTEPYVQLFNTYHSSFSLSFNCQSKNVNQLTVYVIISAINKISKVKFEAGLTSDTNTRVFRKYFHWRQWI